MLSLLVFPCLLPGCVLPSPHPASLAVGVERNSEKEQLERERLAPVSYELEKEKHILRQMQGRRLEELNPGEYHATRNPQHPVMLEGHWQDPPLDELLKHDTVHQLQVGCGTLSLCHLQESLYFDQTKHMSISPFRRGTVVVW